VLIMLRIAILALSATLAVSPALAQATSQTVASSSSTQTAAPDQSLLLDDGTNAMAQACDPARDPNCTPGTNGLLVALGVAGAIGGIIWAISASQKHSVSP
jgi:hypothetical protein